MADTSTATTSDDASSSTSDEDKNKDNKSGSDDNQNDKTDYKALYEKERSKNLDVIESRNAEKRKRQELERAIEDAKVTTAEKTGKVEEVNKAWQERFEKKERELSDNLSQWQNRYHREVTESKFKDMAADKVVKVNQVLAQLKYDGFALDMEENEGDSYIVVKDKKGVTRRDVNKWLDEFLEENPNLAKNPRRSGSGADGGKGNDSAESVKSLEQIEKLPQQERVLMLSKDPALRVRYAKWASTR